jgi:hypothetical protein
MLRILCGLIAACLVAAMIKVGHVITPGELVGLSGEALNGRLIRLAELVALTATHQGLFIMLFAPIAILVAELNRIRGPLFYVLVGVGIALGGFYLQFVSEDELRTIANRYAAQAYVVEGALAGLVYWLISGRYAGWRRSGGLVKANPAPLGQARLKVNDAGNT